MMFTYPTERRKGYGSMLMEWGMTIANKKGVEVLIEASDQGYHLYKKFGLRTVEKVAVDMMVDNPSNTWRRLESDLGELTFWWMWKPHGGVYEVGKTVLPWEAKPELH
jgi:predicted N-acetyltransferase YhbS